MAVKQNNVANIDLTITNKKKFTIDGDANRVIELNTSDMSIMSRLYDSYPKLDDLGVRAMSIADSEPKEAVETLKEVDADMRKLINYIFDSDIADTCAPDGTMYDMFNGEFRFEHIVGKLVSLYENNMDKEYKLMVKKVKKHTDKYTGK